MRIITLALVLIPATLFGQPKHAKKIVIPEAGTVFVNYYYATDSSGALAPKKDADPRMGDDSLVISKSGFKIFGRSNCIEIVAKSHPDKIYWSYATNGDLYGRGTADTVWTRMPFGLPRGKKIMEKLPADSGVMNGQDYYALHNRITQVIGNDTASVGSNVYNCIVLEVVDVRNWKNQNYLQASKWWFSPELGYIVKQNMGWNGPYFLNQQLKAWIPPAKPETQKPENRKPGTEKPETGTVPN